MEIVKQEGIKDCGVCSLLSVIRFYGGNVSLEYLRELTGTTKNGVTALNLVNAATSLGFDSYGLKEKLEDIKVEDLPIISHIIVNKNLKHFIVIYGIDKKCEKILVMDPYYGKKILSFTEFNLMTSNVYIYLKPVRHLPIIKEKEIIKPWVKDFLKNNSTVYLIIFVILEFILTILCSSEFNVFINEAVNYNMLNNVKVITLLFITLELYKELVGIITLSYSLKLTTNLNEYLTKKILSRITLLPYLYYETRTSGEVISKVKDLENIKNFLIKFISRFPLDLMIIILVLIKLIKFNLNVFLIIILIYSIKIIFKIFYLRIYKVKKEFMLRDEDKVNGVLYENVKGMQSIKGMHIEKERLNRFLKIYRNFLSKSYDLIMLSGGASKIDDFLMELARLILLSYSSIMIINGKLKLASLILIYTLYTYFESAVLDMFSIFTNYTDYRVSKKRIEDLFMVNIDNFNCNEYFNKYELKGPIKIKNLNYKYGVRKIFDNLCLEIKKQEKIILIGESGIGKSTLMKIISGFIEVPSGMVKIGPFDISHIHLDLMRTKISYTSQKEALFTGTIRDNIIYKGDEDLDKIVDIVGLNKIFKSSLGLDEVIEEDGENLSGGERQRIILARSLMKKSDIYIFDEAFNELNIEEEKRIVKNILKYLKNKIVIVISHRLTTLDLFDRILVLEGGKIHEKL